MHLHLRDPVEVSSDDELLDRRQVGSAGPIVLSSDDDDDDDENRISGPSTSPIKTVLSAKAKREWNKIKHQLADNLVQELNENVFLGRLPEIPLEWSSRLLTTAGRAHRRRLQPGETLPQVRIELAEKILDDEDRLNRTLAHELCHVATWIISGDLKNPHGANFKAWGSKVNRYRPDIVVTTKHNYKIAYKYYWRCEKTTCGKIFGRHSKCKNRTKWGDCASQLDPVPHN
ncbi:SprT-like family-domain-containing protein [Filobasidium floriforme]|uniref:SprT-like family-domain-containing protein n=1 Tax=Filobasidium floriforme TaxID=5210 RepID=UPI001E8E6495|nr:SprT-like family-domain-containing protein [Filobasidium floriforme]KAH8084659.1 SprT-like family-domain-containing protein [Filobasidium floriforme]